jgi:hypothetical protein
MQCFLLQVYALQSSLPLLEELHLAKNNITSLDVPGLCSSSPAPAAAAAAADSSGGVDSSTGSSACHGAGSRPVAEEGQQASTCAVTGAAASKALPDVNSLSVCDQQQQEDQGQTTMGSGPSSSRQGATSTGLDCPAGVATAAGAVQAVMSPGWALLGSQQPAVELLPGFQRLQVGGSVV